MRSSTRIALAIVVCCIAALVIWFMRPANVSDADQIQGQIEIAVAGANQHAIGRVMSVVSSDYEDDAGLNSLSLRAYMSRAVRNVSKISVTYPNPAIVVKGTTATSDGILTVQVSDAAGGNYPYARNLHLTWRKEKGYRLIFIPTTVWRITGAQYGGSMPGMD